jgi:exodeoxyribonuclease-3
MKFISWNVNGLRACITKGLWDFFNEIQADFFCIQETKMQEQQFADTLPDGYKAWWYSAEKKGYSGTLVLAKHEPLNVQYDLGGNAVIANEGRVITLEYDDFFLVNAYVPNSQRELTRLDLRMEWEDVLREHIIPLKKPVIYCGDLNVAHNEIDLANPKTNTHNAGFTIEERTKLTELLAKTDLVDVYRELYPDKQEYTWWSYMQKAREKNIGWRIDYFLISKTLLKRVKDVYIYKDVMGSDHCPVMLEIS